LCCTSIRNSTSARTRFCSRRRTDLIDLALGLDGNYYLPYQPFYSKEQLRKAYPRVDKFFAAKRIYDPDELFTNKFYEKYGK
jgi:FAD/FMN-containing dehydrogenase